MCVSKPSVRRDKQNWSINYAEQKHKGSEHANEQHGREENNLW